MQVQEQGLQHKIVIFKDSRIEPPHAMPIRIQFEYRPHGDNPAQDAINIESNFFPDLIQTLERIKGDNPGPFQGATKVYIRIEDQIAQDRPETGPTDPDKGIAVWASIDYQNNMSDGMNKIKFLVPGWKVVDNTS